MFGIRDRNKAFSKIGSFWTKSLEGSPRRQASLLASMAQSTNTFNSVNSFVSSHTGQNTHIRYNEVVSFDPTSVVFLGGLQRKSISQQAGISYNSFVHVIRGSGKTSHDEYKELKALNLVAEDALYSDPSGKYILFPTNNGSIPSSFKLSEQQSRWLIPWEYDFVPKIISTVLGPLTLGSEFTMGGGFLQMYLNPSEVLFTNSIVMPVVECENSNFITSTAQLPFSTAYDNFIKEYFRGSQTFKSFKQAAIQAAGYPILPWDATLSHRYIREGRNIYVFDKGIIETHIDDNAFMPDTKWFKGHVIGNPVSLDLVESTLLHNEYINLSKGLLLDEVIPVKGVRVLTNEVPVSVTSRKSDTELHVVKRDNPLEVHVRFNINCEEDVENLFWKFIEENEKNTGSFLAQHIFSTEEVLKAYVQDSVIYFADGTPASMENYSYVKTRDVSPDILPGREEYGREEGYLYPRKSISPLEIITDKFLKNKFYFVTIRDNQDITGSKGLKQFIKEYQLLGIKPIFNPFAEEEADAYDGLTGTSTRQKYAVDLSCTIDGEAKLSSTPPESFVPVVKNYTTPLYSNLPYRGVTYHYATETYYAFGYSTVDPSDTNERVVKSSDGISWTSVDITELGMTSDCEVMGIYSFHGSPAIIVMGLDKVNYTVRITSSLNGSSFRVIADYSYTGGYGAGEYENAMPSVDYHDGRLSISGFGSSYVNLVMTSEDNGLLWGFNWIDLRDYSDPFITYYSHTEEDFISIGEITTVVLGDGGEYEDYSYDLGKTPKFAVSTAEVDLVMNEEEKIFVSRDFNPSTETRFVPGSLHQPDDTSIKDITVANNEILYLNRAESDSEKNTLISYNLQDEAASSFVTLHPDLFAMCMHRNEDTGKILVLGNSSLGNVSISVVNNWTEAKPLLEY